jgi:hypothetical protein
MLCVSFGFEQLELEPFHPGSASRADFLSSFAAWDGEWYMKIVSNGYEWDPDRMSSVAFFPTYPALAALVQWLAGWRIEWSLLLVSHSALLGSFLMLSQYVANDVNDKNGQLSEYAVLALGLFPTTFWMRMCYTESLFLFVTLLAMFGMQCGWRPLWIAIVIGFATATRSSGVALVPVFWWWLWQDRDATSFRRAALQAVAWLPVCLWGLLAYMTFLCVSFGEPLAFVQTQMHWIERPVSGLAEKLWKLATLEPFWAVYVPSSPCYWGRVPPHENPLFNLKFWNPIYVLLTIGLIAYGARRKWLNAREILLAVGLLGIALWFQATRSCMMSQARYASVIFPVYMVMGQILTRLPGPLVGMLCAISGVMLAINSALFVSWYWFY